MAFPLIESVGLLESIKFPIPAVAVKPPLVDLVNKLGFYLIFYTTNIFQLEGLLSVFFS